MVVPSVPVNGATWGWALFTTVIAVDAAIGWGKARSGMATIGPGDEATHLAWITAIREDGHRIKRSVSYTVLTDPPGLYPYLYHWLLSFLPTPVVEARGGLVALLCRSLYVALVGATTALTLDVVGGDIPPGVAAAAASASVAICPILRARSKSSPFQFGLSPRAVGRLTASASALCAAAFEVEPRAWLFVLGSFCIAVSSLTSKFAMQAIVATLVGIAALQVSWRPVSMLGGGLVLGMILSRGRYLQILRAQVRHLVEYRRLMQHTHPMTTGDFTFRIGHTIDLVRRPTRASLRLVRTDPFLRNVVFWFPPLAIVAGAQIAGLPPALRDNAWIDVLTSWAIADVVVWLLILAPGLRFLGEADRYTEYVGALPLVVLGWTTVLIAEPLALRSVLAVSWLAVSMMTDLVLGGRRVRGGPPRMPASWDRELAHLAALPEGTVLTVPIRAAHFVWGRIRRHRYVVENLSDLRHEELYDGYPVVDSKINSIIARYDVGYLLVANGVRLRHHDLSDHDELVRGGSATLYAVRNGMRTERRRSEHHRTR